MLIVDDSAAMRRCIKDLLPATDETLECSGRRRSGSRRLATYRPDWVLMGHRK